jgi:hypothetical protein
LIYNRASISAWDNYSWKTDYNAALGPSLIICRWKTDYNAALDSLIFRSQKKAAALTLLSKEAQVLLLF